MSGDYDWAADAKASYDEAIRAIREQKVRDGEISVPALTIACVRTGTLYGPEYVRILKDMVGRYLSLPHRFVCLTDRPDDLSDIECMRIDDLGGWWSKLELFRPGRFTGRVCYFDLDVAIVGPLDELVQQDGIIADWNLPMFNSSVMGWEAGTRDIECPAEGQRDARWGTVMQEMFAYGDQQWIASRWPDWPTYPPEWCVSYRKSAQFTVPDKASVVCFHGQPKPAAITTGWVPEVWKIGGAFVPKFTRDGNVNTDILIDHMRVNCARPLAWFTPGDALKGKRAHIVCGGPGVENNLFSLRRAKKRGEPIIAVNGAIKWLASKGIQPTWGVVMDARESNVRFVENGPKDTWYLIASMCHPSLFDALKGRIVVPWHADLNDARQDAIFKEQSNNGHLVGGGGTVGLRAVLLAVISGCKDVHLYGIPSCLVGDAHHAYTQPENDGMAVISFTIAGDPKKTVYRCQGWMSRQADEFGQMYFSLQRNGVSVTVHGKGLIPDLWAMYEAKVKQPMRKTA